VTNIQRQLGASLDNIGRNKAEVIAGHAFDLARDVSIDVFPEGITSDTAHEFMDGCDCVMDQIRSTTSSQCGISCRC
jgi:molybdopterin/thiamine biosynthesis adenylyltransferase